MPRPFLFIMQLLQENYHLPTLKTWENTEQVAAYARACLHAVGLGHWRYEEDRAKKRLGCCKYTRKIISLSRYFIEHYLKKGEEGHTLIERTILHEIAHALVWHHHKVAGHAREWKHYCALLGIPGERATVKCEPFAPAPQTRTRRPLYAVAHRDTGEIFKYYYSRPRRSSANLLKCQVRGREAETLGKLVYITLPQSEG